MNEKETAKKILELVGGEDNVLTVEHCITRLRYRLKDESIADDAAIEVLDMPQGIVKKGGQYQIIIGPGIVDTVHAETLKLITKDLNSSDAGANGGSVFDRFVDLVSGIFSPILGILAASGMLKGFLALFSAIGLIPADSQMYIVFNAIGDAFFYFMPIFIGYYAMKKFGGTPILGAAIASILVYPAITTMAGGEAIGVLFDGTAFAANVQAHIFGIPLILPASGYASSVLPIIAINFIAAFVEKKSKKFYPDAISLFFIPMTTILVASVIGLLLVGPVISIASSVVTLLFVTVLNAMPVVYGFIIAVTWQLLVMFGLHWALVPMAYLEFAEFQAGNIDQMVILTYTMFVCFAQAGAVAAIYVKTKDAKIKSLAIPAFITALFGITEPAIYGVTLPRKRDFLLSCLAGGIGGFYMALMGVGAYNMGGTGIFAVLSFINPNGSDYHSLINALIALVISLVAGFVLVFLFGQKDKEQQIEDKVSEVNDSILNPVVGEIVDLETINDEMFKNEMMGKTVAIKATENIVSAPISGRIATLFPTNHALGIIDDTGLEVLIHVGIDTVKLNGQGFEALVSQGDVVKVGDPLLNVDFKAVEAASYDSSVLVVVTNEGNKTIDYGTNKNQLFAVHVN